MATVQRRKEKILSICGILILSLTLFAILPLNRSIKRYVEELKGSILHQLEESFGVDLEYTSISPSFLRSLEIRNFRIQDRNDPFSSARVSSLKIRYRLFTLLSGKVWEGIEEIVLEDAYIETNERSLSRIQERFTNTGSSVVPFSDQGKAKFPRVIGKRVHLQFVSSFGTATARDLFFSLSHEGEAQVLQVTTNLTYQGIEGVGFHHFQTRVELTSRFRNLQGVTDTTIVFERTKIDSFLLERQAFKVSTENKKISIKRLEDRNPIDLSVLYDDIEKTISATLLCETFTPSSLIQPLQVSELHSLLNTTLSGKGILTYNLETRKLFYEGVFQGILPQGIVQTSTFLQLDFQGNAQEVRFSELYLKNKHGTVIFKGSIPFPDLIPEGQITLEKVTYPTSYPIDGTIHVTRIDGGIQFEGPFLSWGRAGFYQYRAALYPSKESRFGFQRLEASFSLSPTSKPIQLYGIFPESDRTQALGGINLQDFPLQSSYLLLDQLGGQEILQTLKGLPPLMLSAKVFFQFSAAGWEIDAPDFTLQEEAKQEHFVRGSFRHNPDGVFQIPHLEFHWNNQNGQASIRGKRLDSWVLEFDTNLEMFGEVYRFSTLLDPHGYARITGSYHSKLELHWGKDVGAFGSMSVENLPLVIPYFKETQISGTWEFFYSSPQSWVLDFKHVHLSLSPQWVGRSMELYMSGTLLPGQGTLTSLLIQDPFTTLEGSGVLEFALEAPRAQLRTILHGKAEHETYSIQVAYQNGTLSVDLEVQKMPLIRIFPEERIGGLVEGRVRGQDILNQREVSVDLRIEEGRYQVHRFGGAFSGTLSETRVNAHRIELIYNEFLTLEGKANLDAGKGSLDWDVKTSVSLGKKPFQGRSEGKITFAAPGTLFELPSLYLPVQKGESSFTVLDQGIPKEYREWNIQLVKEGTQVLFSGGPDHAIDGKIDTTGSFILRVRSPVPITFEAVGLFQGEGKVKASFRNILFSLSSFKQYLNFGGFRIDEGIVRGALSIEGSLQDPSFSGELVVESGKARLDIVPEVLGPFQGYLIFREKTVTLNPITLTTKGGTVQVGGTFELERYELASVSIWVDTGPTGGVRLDANFNGVLVDGIGRGRGIIDVEDQEVRISGKVNASNTKITLGEIFTEQATTSTQDLRLSVDLSIETGKLVEFVWPTENFPIIRTYAALGQRLLIQLNTQDGFFLVRGNIGIRGGQIYYFDRVFYLREGRIVFNERGSQFDPVISTRAEIRENTQNGLVRIYLIADNTRLSQFSPRFESEPSLSQLEIFTLLGGGGKLLTYSTQEAVNLSSALLLSGDLFLQSEIIRSFERDMRNRFNLDLFSVRTQIFQNVLTEVLLPQESILLNQTVPSLGRYLDKSSVFLGKYLGSDLFLEYLIQLRAEDPLTSNIRRFGGIGIESEVVFEWKTPFFTLEWSLRPRNPEELFIRDNTLSFRWRYSY
ncbi:MAG: translocation/assembly module TamB [Spirochaetes bacterium]|nr:translocation/assembly module TamB [Spirochaetota bacterium]